MEEETRNLYQKGPDTVPELHRCTGEGPGA